MTSGWSRSGCWDGRCPSRSTDALPGDHVNEAMFIIIHECRFDVSFVVAIMSSLWYLKILISGMEFLDSSQVPPTLG